MAGVVRDEMQRGLVERYEVFRCNALLFKGFYLCAAFMAGCSILRESQGRSDAFSLPLLVLPGLSGFFSCSH